MTDRKRNGYQLTLRVMTYNVHRCRGLDRAWRPERIAEVIASCRADVIALQELDVGRARSGRVDQVAAIARHLGMNLHFFPTISLMKELYGDAILTRWPAELMKAHALPGLGLPGLEPRGALWSSITIGQTTIQVINTHLSFLGRERFMQVNALLGPEWLGHEKCRGPVILMGDLNTTTRSRSYRSLTSKLHDAYSMVPRLGRRRQRATFPTRFPTMRLDYILVGPSIQVIDIEAVRTPLARVASDHLPVVAELGIGSNT